MLLSVNAAVNTAFELFIIIICSCVLLAKTLDSWCLLDCILRVKSLSYIHRMCSFLRNQVTTPELNNT